MQSASKAGDIWANLSLEEHEPAYLQLARQIETRINLGDLPAGSTLPSERKLAVMLGLSRITVQHSYNLLREKQLIRSQGRLGSIVTGKFQSPMNRLRGFTEEMRETGREPSSTIVSQMLVRDSAVADIMAADADVSLLRLKRHRFADAVPMSNEVAWYNVDIAPCLAEADLTGSVYQILDDHGLGLTYCDQSVEAILPSEEEIALFGFTSVTPCVLIKRTSYDRRGRVLEYVEGIFRGDIYRYRLRLNT